jgi:hypothetical protein
LRQPIIVEPVACRKARQRWNGESESSPAIADRERFFRNRLARIDRTASAISTFLRRIASESGLGERP